MPSITIYQQEKDWLAGLKTSSADRNSYAEVLRWVREQYQKHVPTQAAILPTRIIIIVPSDRWDGTLIHSEAGDYTELQARAQADKWQFAMNTWLKAQAGVQAAFSVHMLYSAHPEVDFHDPNGTGLNMPFIAETVVPTEGNLPATELAGWQAYRHSYIVISNRGGHAAGQCVSLNANHPTADIGKCWMGDWQFSALITGNYHAECLALNPNPGPIGSGGYCTNNGASWSHELLHMFGMYCHAGEWLDTGEFAVPFHEQINPGYSTYPLNAGAPFETTLLPGQRAQLRKYSARFVR